MVRYAGLSFVFAALVAAIALLAVTSDGSRHAAAVEPTRTWGNWVCADNPQSTDNFQVTMRYVASLQFDNTPNCPPLGSTVTDDAFGDLTWGDADCSGAINAFDGLALLSWYAGLPGEEPGCPDLGAPIVPQQPAADWENDGTTFEFAGVHTQDAFNLSIVPSRLDVDAQIGNRGPDASAATVLFTAQVNIGSVKIRWIGQSGDVCYDASQEPVPCAEGNPPNDPTLDNCLDGADNDGDSDVDENDSQCVEARAVRESIFLFPGLNDGIYERSFTVACLEAGPVDIDIKTRVDVDAAFVDPDLTNNDSQTHFVGECFLSKGGRGQSGPSHSRGARPYPYEPVALPAGGGPP